EEVARGAQAFVGKRSGRHSLGQDQINVLLVQSAQRYGHAVRLKGGDPFVFGRGQEELEYAEQQGIPVAVVPGISSCLALPELQGVAPTRRGSSQSFWVMTARGDSRMDAGLPADLALAASSQATVIILMGLGRLEAICELYATVGRADWPVLVIQNGSLPNERCWLGTMSDILAPVRAEQDGGPALIVIGPTVSYHPQFARQQALLSLSSTGQVNQIRK
ncbi:MAG: uroporphyrinogen-III C-methyltransferase, partial [Lewinella sp.]|nr:uroporphyrinogen-III C-methyltransferase [Lewinella sp.]